MRQLKPLRPVMLRAQGQDLSFQFSRIEHHRLTFFVRESAVLVGEGNELFTDPHEFGYFFPHCHALFTWILVSRTGGAILGISRAW